MRITLFILLSITSAFGQIQVVAPSASIGRASHQVLNIQNITITVQPNQYLGTNVSITANENGATVTSWKWRILHRYFHTSGLVDTLVHQTSTSQNPTFSIDSTGFYDIQLIARNNTDKYVNYQTRYFVVLQPRFTEGEADLVIDMSVGSNVKYYDFSSAPVPDYKIYIKNSNAGTAGLEFRSLRGTAGHPVRIQKSNDNVQVQFGLPSGYGTGKQWYFSQYGSGEGAQYIIIDGFNLDGSPGIKITNGAVSNISVRFEGKITDVSVYGIEVQSNPSTIDGAAIAVVPTVASDNSKATWAQNNIHVYRCVGIAGEEFVYINESNQGIAYPANNGFNPPSGYGIVVSRCVINGAGRDAIQVGSCGFEIEDNYANNFGQQHDSGGQESFIVVNSGGFGTVKRNYGINGEMMLNIASGEYAFSPSTSDGRGAGQATPQPLIVEGNIYKSGTYGAGGTDETHAIYIQNNPNSGAGNWNLTFKNNVIDTDNKCAEMLLALGGYTSQNFTFANNIVIKSGNAGDTQEFNVTGNGKATLQSGTKTINNLVQNQGDDLSGYHFADYSTGDFSITSLLSTAYSGSPTTLSVSVDYYGYPLPVPVTGYFFGAQGNYNKRVIAP